MDEATRHLSPFLLGPSPVPSVDPADLRNAWELQEEVLADLRGSGLQEKQDGQTIIDIRSACSPGADCRPSDIDC